MDQSLNHFTHSEDLVTTFEFLETELKNGPNFEDNTCLQNKMKLITYFYAQKLPNVWRPISHEGFGGPMELFFGSFSLFLNVSYFNMGLVNLNGGGISSD